MSRWGLRLALAAATIWLGTSTGLRAGDWPQWRGPDRSDVSNETGLLKTWPDGGPKRLWLFDKAGIGYSGPAIAGGKLYTMGARDGGEQLIAVDAATGRELWAARIGEILKNRWGDGPRGTPAVDGEFVYAMGARGDLICTRADDGKLVWQRSMRDLGGSTPGWGYCESVLVDGNKVLCTPGGAKGTIAALNAKTGELLWQTKEITDPAHYSSTIVAEHAGKRQYIQLTEKHVLGVAADDGKLLWSVNWPGKTAVIPTPVFHDGYVFVTSGYEVGCKLIRLGSNNEATEVYFKQNEKMVNHHGGVILVNGHIYGHSDREGWLCLDLKTGEKVWAENSALGKGAIAYADGKFYCLAEKDGTLALIDASPKGWKEHGRFKLDPQTTQRSPSGRIWTHPVISNGRLYLRDQELLSCYLVRAN